MNYYELLGITPDATLVDIKKAYRRAAFRCHPDRNPPERKIESEKEFKRVSEAYQVLSDPVQRKLYDCCGRTDDYIDLKGASELFKELFPDISADISNETWEIIDNIFDEIDNGKSFVEIAKGLPYLKILKTQLPRVIDIVRDYFTSFTKTDDSLVKTRETGPKPVIIINEMSLEFLNMRGSINIKYPLLRYNEDGEAEMVEEDIDIRNYLTTKKIYMSDNGHEYEPGRFSGLIIYNRVEPHPRFKRKSTYDLYVVERVNITDLVMRRMYYFQWLDGSYIEIPLSQTLLNLPVICLRGWGLMDGLEGGINYKGVGDLYIHFQINHISTVEYGMLQEIQPLSTTEYKDDPEDLHIDVPFERVHMVFDA